LPGTISGGVATIASTNGSLRISMKMGTIRSPCRYDAAARHALQSVNLRRPTILRYASLAAWLPDIAGWSGYPSTATLQINHGIDVMCQPDISHHKQTQFDRCRRTFSITAR
jgi:hypothetical protein